MRTFFQILGAFAAWGLWLTEVYWIKGWAGLAWLSGFNWSALPICALVVVLCAQSVAVDVQRLNRARFIAIGFVLAVGTFAVVRWAAFELFSGSISAPLYQLEAVLVLLIAVLAFCVGLTVAVNRWLGPVRSWTVILLAAGLLLVLLLSFITIRIFPAFNGSTDELHAFKMGYPVFWITVLIPLALRLGAKREL